MVPFLLHGMSHPYRPFDAALHHADCLGANSNLFFLTQPGQRRGQCIGAMLRRIRHALCAHDADVVDAQEG
ncbi:hypothetical protein TP47_16855 [Xanthomonas citri pv. aurantifolii]|nr:hypothetical protein TP47_16855 [Xanthomonas citri pv. aurantifolii]TBX04893.1 hypothetical protein TP46_02825 [Xanthomonas citri pv. aurantifolii]